jgi:hypothetical protein
LVIAGVAAFAVAVFLVMHTGRDVQVLRQRN